eukprot:c21682_g3_i1.p1 GENE.c21682_g3_i1~~c21682_g3_i1.p1  ORF type:complete len:921 (+),score=384.10 c21682_g3_i1:46-2808(+)
MKYKESYILIVFLLINLSSSFPFDNKKNWRGKLGESLSNQQEQNPQLIANNFKDPLLIKPKGKNVKVTQHYLKYSPSKHSEINDFIMNEVSSIYMPPSHGGKINHTATKLPARDGEIYGKDIIQKELDEWNKISEQMDLKWEAMRNDKTCSTKKIESSSGVKMTEEEKRSEVLKAIKYWHRNQKAEKESNNGGGGPPLMNSKTLSIQKKFTCAGKSCFKDFKSKSSSFLEVESEETLTLSADDDDKYKAGCFCSGNPNLSCKQVCKCSLKPPGTDGVLYSGTLLYDENMITSLLQVNQKYDPTPDDENDPDYGGEPETCFEDGRWCTENAECCPKCICTLDGVCDCEKTDTKLKGVTRYPSPATKRDETAVRVQPDSAEYTEYSIRTGGSIEDEDPDTKSPPVQLSCTCESYECIFNSTCDCKRPDEWETWRCALMGFRGRAIKLDGSKRQYLQFIYPPLRCAEFTLEFWVKTGPHVRTWSRFIDVGGGMHRFFMIAPKGGGWWGLCSIWRYGHRWGWVRTEALEEGLWSHVSVLFGYWHACLLVDGEYRDCRWNHWRTRNAWRYWDRWRNWIGKSQFWWDPFLTAELDEMRLWCGYRSGYWINEFMYQRLENYPGNLMGLWRFNENSGIWAHDTVGGNHLILRREGDWQVIDGTATSTVNEDERYPKFVVSDAPVFHRVQFCPKDLPRPKPRYALNFGGSRGHHAWLYLPIELMHKLEKFTIEGWVRIPGWYNDHWMRWFDIGMGDWYPWRNILLSFGNPGRRPLFFGGRHPKSSFHYQAAIAPPLQRDRWVHVAAVLAGNVASVIVDGQTIATATMSTNPLEVCGFWNFIGRSAYPWDSFFYGQMSELRFWNYARSPTETLLQRKVPLTGSEPGLVAYYSFAEGRGRRVMDQTANHFDAPIIGNVRYVRSTSPVMPLF